MPSKADATIVDLGDESALDRFTARLAAALPVPACLALHGDLGAGKTRLVKGLAAAVGLDPDGVVSPTFGLVHVLPLPDECRAPRLVHADLHRLAGAGDLAEIGWDELSAGPAWVCVEWAERAGAALPPDRLEVAIEILGETSRRLHLRALGPRHAAVLDALRPPIG